MTIRRTVKVAALTVAFTASGPAMALASTGPSTSGDGSILGGNQVAAPISVPVSVCGNALALLGTASATCQGATSVSGGSGGGSAATSGNGSVGGGNQVSVPVRVPVGACGNSVAILGNASSACQGASASPPSGDTSAPPTSIQRAVSGGAVTTHLAKPAGSPSGDSPPGMSSDSASLPTTGANFTGLLVLAGGTVTGGAAAVAFAARRRRPRGRLASARRAATVTR